MLIKHQLHSNFFIISGFHPLFDKEPNNLSEIFVFYNFFIFSLMFISNAAMLVPSVPPP